MREHTDELDLQILWQSKTEEIDMEMILDTRDKLERGRILGRRIMDGFHLAMGLMVLLYGVLEFAGVLNTGGWITGGVFIFFCLTLGVTMRQRRKNPEIAGLSPRGLLENAIDRARNNLLMGRVLYAVVPLSELIGGLIGYTIAHSILDSDRAGVIPLTIIIVFILGICLLTLAVMIYGIRLAGRKKVELRELRARLAAFESKEGEI